MGEFVTGQVLRVDLGTGATTLVNAGHLCPLLLRDGRVRELQLEIDLPFGLYPGPRVPAAAPGAGAGGPAAAGHRRGAGPQQRPPRACRRCWRHSAGKHARELVHELGDLVLRPPAGKLRDDATVLCLDWMGDDRP